jgi:hypothetical protein
MNHFATRCFRLQQRIRNNPVAPPKKSRIDIGFTHWDEIFFASVGADALGLSSRTFHVPVPSTSGVISD